MILVDTSVWVEHLRRGHWALKTLLERGEVGCHPFVIGELACGSLRRRDELLSLLSALPQAPVAGHQEALAFIDAQSLAGSGLGWVAVHLLASARLGRMPFLTLDRRLASAAQRIGLSAGAP